MIPLYDQLAYMKHKAQTHLGEFGVVIAWIISYVRELDDVAQLILTCAAVITTIFTLIRQFVEIRTKRRESEIARIEIEIKNQELWDKVEQLKIRRDAIAQRKETYSDDTEIPTEGDVK